MASFDGSPPPILERTPLPVRELGVLSSALFANSLITTVVFPFAPQMVAYFGVTDDDSKLGYYSGVLASSFFLGSFVSGPVWGQMTDRIGRKTVLMIGLVNNIFWGTLFGFSQTLWFALATRFILGLFSTVFISAKTSMTEMTDETNQAQAFGVFGLCWGFGLIVGPVFGGIFAEPATKWRSWDFWVWLFPEDGLFGTYPFLLPCLIITVATVPAAIFCFIYLPETMGMAKAIQIRVPSKTDLTEGLLDGQPPQENIDVEEDTILVEDDPGWWQVVCCEFDTIVSGALFCLCGFMFVAFDELFPLWSETYWYLGGLDFSTTNAGIAQAAAGVSLIPITLLLYPWLTEKIGAVNALRMSLFTGIFQALIPLVRLLGPNIVKLQIACCIIFAIRSFNETAMAALFILTGNSVRYPKYMGAVNGMLATVQAFFRAIAPTVVGSIYAWSDSSGYSFPFDYHFTWLLLGVLHVLALLGTLFLDEGINQRQFGRNEGLILME